jgi:anti-sigma-K factor RskA
VNDELRDLAAGDALGALRLEERSRLQHEAARDPKLAAHRDEYRATVAILEAAVAREAPPSDLFERVLASLAEDRSPAPVPAEPQQARRSWRERLFVPAFGAGFAAAAAVAALVFVVSSGTDLGTSTAQAAVTGAPEFAGVHGEARLYDADRSDGTLVLTLAAVPSLPSGAHYEVWVLRESADGAMEAVGVFDPTASDIRLEYPLPGPGDYQAVDVSVEPDGGSPEHSGRSLAGGKFEPSGT